ncbi:unnamed protein product [Polarella glacialis]|nr:unnamed protein product [Polarella glacialis]
MSSEGRVREKMDQKREYENGELSEKNLAPQQRRFDVAKTTAIENLVGSHAAKIKLDSSLDLAVSTLMLVLQSLCSWRLKARLMDVKSAIGQSGEYERADGPLIATPPLGDFP